MNWFKNLKLRHKIGILFLVIEIMIQYMIIFTVVWGPIFTILMLSQWPLITLINIYDKSYRITSLSEQIIMILLSLLTYYIIGYLIGLVIEKIKKK